MKTHEDQLDVLMARLEKRLTSFEANVSHMKSRLSELNEIQEEFTSTIYDPYVKAV
ncbi:hypothetical protein [Kurthia sibirica]|uniref:hypothetical protein n=1 Tax=Kurthia sibirica TaxID=202750 RepID=UPI00116E4680|nr:hypothetical protein [Kurthia sibirica]GEK33304.1 hypothetical protein KSI01_08370 [Kurthia sibirica]